MAKASEFRTYLHECLDRHDIYVYGAQGELVADILPMIPSMAQTSARAKDALQYITDGIHTGYDMMRARAYDCSGLSVYWLMLKGILKVDTTAAGLYDLCRAHPAIKDLKIGDMVFNKKKTHVGYYDGDGYIIEAKGHKYGVCRTKLSEGSWELTGRPDWWEPEKYILTRKLSYVKGATMTGDDVREVQQALLKAGYDLGKYGADGKYGPTTSNAVADFQSDKALKKVKYGVVDETTARALGLEWGE